MTDPAATLGYLERAIRYGAGFCETKADQSMTRLVTLICAVAGLVCAMAGYHVALRPHLDDAAAKILVALTGLAGAFVAAGCVALSKRTKSTDCPCPTSPPEKG